jgi:dihydroxy-acid dehydratase
MPLRSDQVKKGIERMPNRALLYASGVTPEQMSKPFIGVCSSFTDLIPGHIGMRSLERKIEWGIAAGGGVPFLFGVPGICDGIAMGHSGMHYSLPSRELIADIIESITEAHRLDGLILLTNCDKITPGMLMAACRLDIPAVAVTAGPMLSGHYQGRRLALVRDTFEAVGLCQAGKLSESEAVKLAPWQEAPGSNASRSKPAKGSWNSSAKVSPPGRSSRGNRLRTPSAWTWPLAAPPTPRCTFPPLPTPPRWTSPWRTSTVSAARLLS